MNDVDESELITSLTAELASISDDRLQAVMGAVVREYSSRAQSRYNDGAEIPKPLSSEGPAAATDVVIATRNMLRVYEIAPFELGFLPY